MLWNVGLDSSRISRPGRRWRPAACSRVGKLGNEVYDRRDGGEGNETRADTHVIRRRIYVYIAMLNAACLPIDQHRAYHLVYDRTLWSRFLIYIYIYTVFAYYATMNDIIIMNDITTRVSYFIRNILLISPHLYIFSVTRTQKFP